MCRIYAPERLSNDNFSGAFIIADKSHTGKGEMDNILTLLMCIASNVTGTIVNTEERLDYLYDNDERVRNEIDYIIYG